MIREYLSRQAVVVILTTAALALLVCTAEASKGKGKKVKQPRVEGTLTAVDAVAKTVTITPLKGAAVTVTVGATTKVEINDHDATTTALLNAALIGQPAEATYVAATRAAVKVEVGTDVD